MGRRGYLAKGQMALEARCHPEPAQCIEIPRLVDGLGGRPRSKSPARPLDEPWWDPGDHVAEGSQTAVCCALGQIEPQFATQDSVAPHFVDPRLGSCHRTLLTSRP